MLFSDLPIHRDVPPQKKPGQDGIDRSVEDALNIVHFVMDLPSHELKRGYLYCDMVPWDQGP